MGIPAEQLINFTSTAMLLMDQQLKIHFSNSAAENLFALSSNQLQDNSFDRLILHSSLDIQRMYQVFEDQKSLSDGEVNLTFGDGRHVLADITATLIEEGGVPLMLVELRQIDQQKRITKENQQWAQQQAARELVRGLAHEIKNPLGGLRGAAQLLDKALSDPELQEYTQMIIEQADRLRNLVDKLLGPNKPPSLQRCNIHRVLEKIYLLLKAEQLEHIELIRDYDPSIPELLIDQDKIQQAVLNMARNGIQALSDANTENAQLALVTRIERQLTIHGKIYPLSVLIRIVDNGPGIPVEIKDTLFYPMVTGKEHGTGLGLSIAQSLVAHHGGKIEVESWPGHTEFNIYLPITDEESD